MDHRLDHRLLRSGQCDRFLADKPHPEALPPRRGSLRRYLALGTLLASIGDSTQCGVVWDRQCFYLCDRLGLPGCTIQLQLSLIPDHLQGRVNSITRLLVTGSQPLGIALTGVLIQFLGPVATVLALFAPQLLLAVIVTLFSRRLFELPVVNQHTGGGPCGRP